MNSAQAFGNTIRAQAQGARHMVFDWDKAALYIRENGIKDVSAGLHSDLEWTGGKILENGIPVPVEDTYTYLASNWAVPVLYFADGTEVSMWKYSGEGDNAKIYWPESALAIFEGREP